MEDTSEEKSLPATPKKLQDAREKGQVAKSQDLAAAVAVSVSVLYLYAVAPRIETHVRELIDAVVRIYREPFAELLPQVLELAARIFMLAILPLVAIVCVVVVLASVAAMRGPVFSVEPLTPNMDHINPAKGLKRIFSLKSIVEFIKALVKVTALAVAFVVVFRLGLQQLLESPYCGPACIYDTFFSLLTPLVKATLIAFVVVGVIDVVLQRRLFLREMRMTRTEFKREMKDVEGDPVIKRERTRRAREAASFAVKLGLRHASIVLGQPGGVIVGLRFVRGETPAPVIVCKGNHDQARTLIAEASQLGIPVVEASELAQSLHAACALGDPLPVSAFQPVADILTAARLV
jgi:type III secretion protein U